MSAYPYDHECNCQGGDTRMVAVPVEGEWLVRGGKIVEVTETNLDEPGDECGSDWTWTVCTKECL